MDADLGWFAFTGDPRATVPEGRGGELALIEDNFQQPGGRTTRRIFLEAMMHLDDLGVVVGSQYGSGPTSQGKKQVHSD